MKRMKWKALILVLFFSFLMSPKQVQADGWGVFGENIAWNFTESTGVLTLTGTGAIPGTSNYNAPWSSYSNSIKKVIIGEGITSVGNGVFNGYAWGYQSYYRALEEVILPSTMKEIGSDSFNWLRKLSKINFPSGLEKIGTSAFGRTALTSIDIPGTVKEIGSSAFLSCGSISNITLHEGTEIIGNACFDGTSISNIVIPSSLTTLGDMAFAYCKNLVSITIPSTVTKMGSGICKDCSSLRYAEINTSSTVYSCFGGCNSLEMVKFGDSVTTLSGTLRECTNLKAVFIPASVNKISDDAFWAWSHSSNVKVYGYTGSAAWTHTGLISHLDFLEVSIPENQATWDQAWAECVNRKSVVTDTNTNNSSSNTNNNSSSNTNSSSSSKKKTIKNLKVTAKKGKKYITVKTLKGSKITITLNKKILKNGKKVVKKRTIKNCKATTKFKLSKKLPKNTKINITVSKSGYKTKTKNLIIKK